jgi:hypothetical protein
VPLSAIVNRKPVSPNDGPVSGPRHDDTAAHSHRDCRLFFADVKFDNGRLVDSVL